jgi:hypothetical protein
MTQRIFIEEIIGFRSHDDRELFIADLRKQNIDQTIDRFFQPKTESGPEYHCVAVMVEEADNLATGEKR